MAKSGYPDKYVAKVKEYNDKIERERKYDKMCRTFKTLKRRGSKTGDLLYMMFDHDVFAINMERIDMNIEVDDPLQRTRLEYYHRRYLIINQKEETRAATKKLHKLKKNDKV